MTAEQIGAAAGELWELLREHGDEGIPLGTLKRRPGVRSDLTLTALGWLAREGKIHFVELPRNRVRVTLAQTELGHALSA